jgi:hypothetical protein
LGIAAILESRGLKAPVFKNLMGPNYWPTSPCYEHAVAVPVCNNPKQFPEKLTDRGAPEGPGNLSKLTPLSRELRVVLHAAQPAPVANGHTEQMFQLAARDANNQNTKEAPQLARCTLDEIVGFSRFQYMNLVTPSKQKKGPLGTPGSSLADLVAEINTNVTSDRGIRHQWPVVGGEYVGSAPERPTRDGSFVGFLQMCLEDGLFS